MQEKQLLFNGELLSVKNDHLVNAAARLCAPLSLDQADQLLEYGALLEKWNKAFNLVSRQDISRLYSRHLLDSLAGVPLLVGQQILDLGSGAGLPGIPLAVAKQELSFHLCDRSSRRCRFLKQVCQSLGLSNVQVWEGDFLSRELGAVTPEKFDTIVARGVATATEVWAMVQDRLANDGRLLIYESTQLDTDVQTQGIPEQDEVKVSRHTYSVVGLEQTHSILRLERA